MPIRQQFDTGVYQGFNRNPMTLADVFSAARGIQGMVQNVRQAKAAEKLSEEDEFLDGVYSRNFADFDGRDPADFQRRNKQAMMEIEKARPNLYRKALGLSGAIEEAMQGRITYDTDLDERITQNEASKLQLENNRLLFNDNFLKSNKMKQDFMGEEFALVAEGKQSYGNAVNHIKALGIDANLPSEEQFNQDPGQFYNFLIRQKMKTDEEEAAYNKRKNDLGLQKQEKELEWYDRIQQAGINAKNRMGTGIPSGGGEGVDNVTDLAAYQLAREIGGVRGIKTIYPVIMRNLQAGMSIDQIRDEMRYAQQSQDFSGPAREAMQQLYAGKSGKAADRAFDAFDDLLSSGDQRAVGDFLKRSARNTAGTEQSKQIMGTERTLEFLTEIENDLANYEANGGSTNIFTGTAEDFRKKLGYVKNTEMRTIAEKIHSAIMRYRRSMSGAAFSVPESAEYSALFPSIKKTGDLNTASISALKQMFSGDIDQFYRSAMGSNAYDTFIKGGGRRRTPRGDVPRQPPAPTSTERQNKLRMKYGY